MSCINELAPKSINRWGRVDNLIDLVAELFDCLSHLSGFTEQKRKNKRIFNMVLLKIEPKLEAADILLQEYQVQ